MVTTVAGTNPYAAPEILDYQTPTDRVDIYSLGCVFAFMLTGKSPKQMSREEFQSSLSKSVRKIINKCTADYSRRYKDVTHLKKDISALLSTSTMPVPEFFHILPGLRSGKPLEICIFSPDLLCTFSSSDIPDLPLTFTCLDPSCSSSFCNPDY